MLVGVVGGDDVAVRQARGDFHLAAEPLDRIGRIGSAGRDQFDRHDPFHVAVDGLEHLAHAAGTDLVEDDIFAEHQAVGLAGRQGLGLERGELARADQHARQRFAIQGFFAQAVGRQERANLGFGQQRAPDNVGQELGNRSGHG